MTEDQATRRDARDMREQAQQMRAHAAAARRRAQEMAELNTDLRMRMGALLWALTRTVVLGDSRARPAP